MNDVKVYYDMMKRGSRRDSNNHKELTFSLLKNVYTYLHEYHNSLKISSKYDIQRFRHFIRLHLIGRQHDVLPHKWQYDLNVSCSIVILSLKNIYLMRIKLHYSFFLLMWSICH